MDDLGSEFDDRLAPPRAPLRVMQILAELAKAPEGTSLVRLSDNLQVPKTSLFSLLRSLEVGNFVISENGYHRLGQEAYNLASAISHQDGFAGRIRPVLQKLQQSTGETVMLGVPTNDWSKLILADVIEADSSLRFTARVGAERHLYSTSIGLAALAFASREQQKRYIEQTKLIKLTPTTIGSASALRQALARTKTDGYVVNSGSVLGLTAIGVPVFGPQGVVASISIAGPSLRIEDRANEFIKSALAAGRQITQMLSQQKAPSTKE